MKNNNGTITMGKVINNRSLNVLVAEKVFRKTFFFFVTKMIRATAPITIERSIGSGYDSLMFPTTSLV